MQQKSIEKSLKDYGVIGDTRTAIVIGKSGSIDWACLPDFDSPAVFAALLDGDAGHFCIQPADRFHSVQYYESGTNVLVTEFTTGSAKLRVRDFMPYIPHRQVATAEVHRIVECAEGSMQVRLSFAPRFDYGRSAPELVAGDCAIIAQHEQNRLALAFPAGIRWNTDQPGCAESEFDVAAGDEIAFVLDWGMGEMHPPESYQCYKRIWETRKFWRRWISRLNYHGRYREAIERSLLALKLLSYEPTGAIVAAATASLPEWPGGTRNWDYRFTWIRDSAFILGAFFRAGYTEEGTAYFDFILQRVFDGEDLRILYDVHGREGTGEEILSHLRGFASSKPVRIGNGASHQLQLDVYGSLLDAAWQYQNFGGVLTNTEWVRLKKIVGIVVNRWREPDSGIWEARSELQHYTYSKVWAWVAIDRAMRIADRLGFRDDLPGWRREAESIRADIMANGWNPKVGAFTQAYGSNILDAALLIMPEVGFLDVHDEKFAATFELIRRQLGDGERPLFYRYDHRVYDDGVGGPEGRFLLMSFWHIDCLILQGRLSEARSGIEQMLTVRNPLGLYSECVHREENGDYLLLGNFPQGFSHLGLVNSVFKLDQARRLGEL